jgi:ABC-type sugar transport system ATPase subunit
VRALDGVSLSLGSGEIVGLVGENGAGKSTLLSILSGAEQPDEGHVRAGDGSIGFASYTEANRAGVFRAHQDQGLIGNLSVYENLFLGHESFFTVGGLLRPRKMREAATRHLLSDEIGASRVDPNRRVAELPLDQRQLVEITRAFALAELLDIDHPVVLLDETTASLNRDEVADLFRYLTARRSQASFLFVSHRLHEVFEICDRIYVLMDGKVVAERLVSETDEAELHQLMVGREREENHYLEDRRRDEFGAELLRVDGLTHEPNLYNVSLQVREGEILGIGGVTGCGKTLLARAIAGDLHTSGGEVVVGGVSLKPARATSRKGRVAYGPIDRHGEGLSLIHSVRFNSTWSSLNRFLRGPFLSVARERGEVRDVMRRHRIAAPSMETPVRSLSGGNQQKVMLGRLVSSDAKVLVLDNPTRGVDVGARQEIYGQLRDLADLGYGIVMISDDLRELLGMADRLLAMRDGRVAKQWTTQETRHLSEEDFIARMV